MLDQAENGSGKLPLIFGFNGPTVKLVLLLLVGSFFVYIIGIMTIVSIYHFPHVWNFYLSETIVMSILSIAPASIFHKGFIYMKTGRVPFITRHFGKLFGVSYLISITPLLVAVSYEYFTGFLSFL